MSAATQDGNIGNGVRVGFRTGSPGTWHAIEGILDCTPPTLTYDKVDNTVHKDGDFKTNITGLASVSDTMLKLRRDPDSATAPYQNLMFGYAKSKTLLSWRVEIPANPDRSVDSFEAFEFQARVGAYAHSAPIAGLQELDIPLIFSGDYFDHYAPMASLL